MESKRNLTEKCIELFNIGKKSSQIAQETGLSIASVYYRLSRHYPKYKNRKKPTVRQRFEMFIMPEPMSGCWLWTGALIGGGYGAFFTDHQWKAHRFSYQIHKGDIPDHLMVRHTCDQASCVNPDHLFLGTHQDNMDDKVRRNRQAKGRKCIPKRNL